MIMFFEIHLFWALLLIRIYFYFTDLTSFYNSAAHRVGKSDLILNLR